MTATGRRCGLRPRPADHPVGQGRRAAHVQHRQRQRAGQVVGQHGRDRPAEQDRVPGARHLLGPAVPAGQPVGDRPAGSGSATPASRSGRPGARPERRAGPASSTTPVSIPPEPVTGFCILPRLGDDLRAPPRRIASGSPSWPRAAGGTRPRPGSAARPGPGPRRARSPARGSSRQAACGSTPAGSTHPVQAQRRARLRYRSGHVIILPAGGMQRTRRRPVPARAGAVSGQCRRGIGQLPG